MSASSATLLSWITAEVDQALTLVRDQIAKFTTGGGDAAVLETCPGHLVQVSGTGLQRGRIRGTRGEPGDLVAHLRERLVHLGGDPGKQRGGVGAHGPVYEFRRA